MSEIDKNTFGDTDAAIMLAEILGKPGNDKVRAKISKRYCEYCEMMNEIMYMHSPSMRSSFFRLVWRDGQDRINKLDAPEEVKSFTLNIMKKIYRMNIKYCREVIITRRAKDNRERYLAKKNKENKNA